MYSIFLNAQLLHVQLNHSVFLWLSESKLKSVKRDWWLWKFWCKTIRKKNSLFELGKIFQSTGISQPSFGLFLKSHESSSFMGVTLNLNQWLQTSSSLYHSTLYSHEFLCAFAWVHGSGFKSLKYWKYWIRKCLNALILELLKGPLCQNQQLNNTHSIRMSRDLFLCIILNIIYNLYGDHSLCSALHLVVLIFQ